MWTRESESFVLPKFLLATVVLQDSTDSFGKSFPSTSSDLCFNNATITVVAARSVPLESLQQVSVFHVVFGQLLVSDPRLNGDFGELCSVSCD